VYQKKHEVAVEVHAKAGCSSGCWDMIYNKYDDGTATPAACSNSN
jgi:hypothetical protein